MSQIMKPLLSFLTVASMLFGSVLPACGTTGKSAVTKAGNEIITIPCGMVNCYVIIGDGQCILVDTASSAYRSKLYKAIKDYNITLIVLTHSHYDHIQNAAYLSEKFNAKIAIHEGDCDLIANQAAHKTSGRSMIQKFSSFFSNIMGSFIKTEPFKPDFFLTAGQSLAEFGVNCEIIELKGHTKGSAGILLNNGKDFIVGDSCMNIFSFSEPFLFEDYGALNTSINIIKNSCAETIFFGHGNPLTKPQNDLC